METVGLHLKEAQFLEPVVSHLYSQLLVACRKWLNGMRGVMDKMRNWCRVTALLCVPREEVISRARR